MVITSNAVMNVITTDKSLGADNRTYYFKLGLAQDGEVGKVSCTEEVYSFVVETFSPLKPYVFTLAAKTGEKYDSFKVVGVSELPSEIPTAGNTDKTAETATEASADNKTGNKADNKATTK